MPNLRMAARTKCKPNEIFMIVDGDDELIGRQVLKLFNAVFQEKKVWYAYSNFLGSNRKIGYSRPYPPEVIKDNSFREVTFTTSHLRAYYTQLFLNILQSDLQGPDGNYFTSANDMAITIPCEEMANTRVAYIPEMTYYYNFNTGNNIHKQRLQEQRTNNLKIRSKSKY